MHVCFERLFYFAFLISLCKKGINKYFVIELFYFFFFFILAFGELLPGLKQPASVKLP